MAHLPDSEIRAIVLGCANAIQEHQNQIRELQNQMFHKMPTEQWAFASAALDAILGKNRIIHMSENRFENVGVANTGDISGNVTGNANQTNINQDAQALLSAFANFKQKVLDDPSLPPTQREDAIGATNDLEAEAKKPRDTWNMSKVRNSVAALGALASGAKAIHSLYETLYPLIAAHFHLGH
jgi:hypothetical protein